MIAAGPCLACLDFKALHMHIVRRPQQLMGEIDLFLSRLPAEWGLSPLTFSLWCCWGSTFASGLQHCSYFLPGVLQYPNNHSARRPRISAASEIAQFPRVSSWRARVTFVYRWCDVRVLRAGALWKRTVGAAVRFGVLLSQYKNQRISSIKVLELHLDKSFPCHMLQTVIWNVSQIDSVQQLLSAFFNIRDEVFGLQNVTQQYEINVLHQYTSTKMKPYNARTILLKDLPGTHTMG